MGNFFSEIWNRRSLIILFAFNDVKLRYKNSALGFFWSFLEPLLMLAVLYFMFTNIIKSGIENYPIYLLLGLILWYMFSRATTMGATSLLAKSGIIQKIYFRREIVVISSCLTAFIMMGFEFVAFTIFVVVFQFPVPSTILFLPFILVLLFIISVGLSLLLAPLTVYFRDVQFIWQIILQAGFFLLPIIYKLDTFSAEIQTILKWNPLVSLFDEAHNVTLYNTLPSLESLLYLVIVTTVVFIAGYLVFKIKDKRLVEEI